MPLQPTYPGVYIQEIPSGTHTIAGVATSITGFVGYLRRGPLNVPVQCLNFGDFQRVFGGLDDQSETSFQVSQFFLNGGSEAWVSRLYGSASPPVQPQALLACGALGSGGGKVAAPAAKQPALTINALNPGTWGENVFVSVDYMSAGTGTFDLTATLYAVGSGGYTAAQTQSLSGVTLDQSKPNYIGTLAAGGGNPYAGLVAITDPSPPLVPGQPYSPPAYLPLPSGTMLAFAQPPAAVTGAVLTVTVVTAAAVTTTLEVPIGPVAVLSDMVGAIQGALSMAAVKSGLPTLANAVVRSSLSPFPGPSPQTLIQVVATDPALAGCLIGLSMPGTVLSQLLTNVQAMQLQPPAPGKAAAGTPPPPPDGTLPTGFDVAGNATNRTGIYALEAMGLVNLLCRTCAG